MSKEWIKQKPEGVLLVCHVQPGAKKSEIIGEHGAALKIKIAAPPVDGAANEALCDFLSKFFSVKKKDITIERGQSSRHKAVLLKSVNAAFIRGRLTNPKPRDY